MRQEVKILDHRGQPMCSTGNSSPDTMALHPGADTIGVEIGGWNPPLATADEEYLPERDKLVSRAMDVRRRYPMMSSGIRQQADHTTGTRFRPEPRPAWRALGWSREQAREYSAQVRAWFRLVAESPDHWLDASRHDTFSRIQRLVYMTWSVAGEALITVDHQPEPAWRSTPIELNIIDPSRLRTPPNIMDEARKKRTVAGVETNKFGRPDYYNIRRARPSEGWDGQDKFDRLPRQTKWGRARVIHVFDREYPGQTRGKSTWVTSLKKIKMLEKFEDTVLQAAVFQAMIAMYVKTDTPRAAAEQLGAGGPSHHEQIKACVKGQAEVYATSGRPEMNGLKIPFLAPNDELAINRPSQPIETFESFEDAMLRHIAVELDLDLASLTKDYRNTNYSGARQGVVQNMPQRNQRREQIIGAQCATQIYRAMLENAIAVGDIKVPGLPTEKSVEAENIRFNHFLKHRDALTQVEWPGPGIMHIDPAKGAKAAQMEMDMGVLTKSSYASRYMGQDFEDIHDELMWERQFNEEVAPSDSGGGK